MKKFMVIYHTPASAMGKMNDTKPEDMQNEMEAWKAWGERVGKGLIDFGTPLGNGKNVTTSGATASESDVNGYSMLEAESIDQAVSMLKDHPHLKWAEGCEVEVFESLPVPS
jgi:hypothetical protein